MKKIYFLFDTLIYVMKYIDCLSTKFSKKGEYIMGCNISGKSMRDKLKSEKYFDEFIEEDSKRIKKFISKLEKGEVRKERIFSVKCKIHDLELGILIARYSKGDNLPVLKDTFVDLCHEWEEVFQPEYYNKNLIMISLAVLFNVGKEQMKRVLDLFKNAGVEDWVFEFMLNAVLGVGIDEKIPLIFPKDYMTLKQVAFSDNPMPLLKKYLLEEWYDMCIWKQWKTPQNRIKNLMKLGVDKDIAWITAYTGSRIAYVCQRRVMNFAINKERLTQFGLVSMIDYYTKRCVTC